MLGMKSDKLSSCPLWTRRQLGEGLQLLGVPPCPEFCGLRSPGVELCPGRPVLACVFQEMAALSLILWRHTVFWALPVFPPS